MRDFRKWGRSIDHWSIEDRLAERMYTSQRSTQ